jgi:two-component system, OmpR family, sensor histidine kinase VicK
MTELTNVAVGERMCDAPFRALVESVADYAIFTMDADGRVTSWNTGAERIFGFAASEIVGRSGAMLFTPEDVRAGAPEAELRQAASEGRAVDKRWHQRKGGTRFFADGVVTPGYDDGGRLLGFTKVLQEVTERERMVEQQQALLEATGDGIYGLDLAGRCTFINPAALEMIGHERDAVVGEDMHALIHHHRADGTPYPEAACPIRRALAGEAVRVDDEVLWRQDGSALAVDYTARPIWQGGVVAGAVVAFKDISARKAQDARREALVRSITHDLRNPLATVKGMAQMTRRHLLREGRGERDRMVRNLTSIDTAAGKMDRMLGELLDLARLQAGHELELNLRPVDLVSLARASAEEHQAATARHTITVQHDEPELVGVWDADRLERVLANLLTNAIKYSPEGGPITLTLSCDDDGQGHDWARLVVEDRGVGIPAADLRRLFEGFYRGSNVRSRIGGIGLGLAGAKQVVEHHGGTLTVTSELGRGTAVTLRLPMT